MTGSWGQQHSRRWVGTPFVATGKPSYGTTTITDIIPYEFGGTVDLVMAPDGVRCRVELPASWLSDASEPILRPAPPHSDNRNINALKQPLLHDSKPWLRPTLPRERIESDLRVIDSHIGAGEHRLFEHRKLTERLNCKESDLTIANDLQLSIETGLRLLRARSARLIRELEKD